MEGDNATTETTTTTETTVTAETKVQHKSALVIAIDGRVATEKVYSLPAGELPPVSLIGMSIMVCKGKRGYLVIVSRGTVIIRVYMSRPKIKAFWAARALAECARRGVNLDSLARHDTQMLTRDERITCREVGGMEELSWWPLELSDEDIRRHKREIEDLGQYMAKMEEVYAR